MINRKGLKHGKLLKMAALMLAICFMIPAGVSAATIEEMQEQQAQLESENAQLQSKLDELKDDEAQAEEYQRTLVESMDVLEEQIDTARTNINSLDTNIVELESRISRAETEVADTMEQLKERIKVLYRMGSVSTIEILMNSESLSDFSMRSETMKAVTEHDKQLIAIISQYMDDTSDERNELSRQKAALAEEKKTLESKSAELDAKRTENEALINDLQIQQASAEEVISANEAESESLMQTIEAAIAQKAAEEEAARQAAAEEAARQEAERQEAAQQSGGSGSGSTESPSYGSGSYSGGYSTGFSPTWPLPGVTYISQHFGNGHNGLDIAGSYGTPIVAAEDGQVLIANNYDSWGDSWGYYVLLYHNSTYTTRYAHMSSMVVSNGEYVSKGQVIGYEGSTGNSTGPHLHFEVYQNGVRVNPYQFF